MHRFSSMIVLGAATVVAACSSGEDVYIQTTRSNLQCAYAPPSTSVCDRNWGNITDRARAQNATYLDTVSRLVNTPEEALDRLDAACTEMLSRMGVAPPAVAVGSPAAVRATATCNAASVEIQQRRSPSAFTLELRTPASCTTSDAPPCVLPDTPPRRSCEPPEVTLDLSDTATEADRALVAALEKSVGLVLLKQYDEDMIELTRALNASWNSWGRELLVDGCAPDAPAIKNAVTDYKQFVELRTKLATALGESSASSAASPGPPPGN